MSVISALLEGVGITLIFPLLGDFKNISMLQIPFPLTIIFSFFSEMSVSERFQWVAILLLSIMVIKNIFIYLTRIIISSWEVLVVKHCRMACIHQLLDLAIPYWNKQRSSDVQSLIDTCASAYVGHVVRMTCQSLPLLVTTLVLMCLLVMLSWSLTLISVVIVVLFSYLLSLLIEKIKKKSKVLVQAGYEFNRVLHHVIHGLKTIHLFNREKKLIQDFRHAVEKYNNIFFTRHCLLEATGPFFEISSVFILALMLIITSFLMKYKGGMPTEICLTFFVILFRLLSPTKALNQARVEIISRLPAIRELNNFLKREPSRYLENGTKVFKEFNDKIEFRDISFRYSREDSIVLKDFSFKILKGDNIGIVGPSGVGKSTLIELLLCFYDPQKGQILIDGEELKNFNIESWRKCIGVVSQDTYLFHDTVRENISFGKPGATQEEIEWVAKRAYAHEFICALPQKYETVVGERGLRLSGGQRQRLAIARALIINPQILIFDEATASLDADSECIVQMALKDISLGRTTLTIAHRLSTLSHCDQIIVIDSGKIVQRGSPQQLLKEKGPYSRLVKSQQQGLIDFSV